MRSTVFCDHVPPARRLDTLLGQCCRNGARGLAGHRYQYRAQCLITGGGVSGVLCRQNLPGEPSFLPRALAAEDLQWVRWLIMRRSCSASAA